jgi:serine/threonine protein kinase
MSLSPSIPEPGDVIAGKYQLVSVLGAADASIVFLAEQAGSDEMVALHWYPSDAAGRHASALTEARLTALAHLPQRCGFRVRETLETLTPEAHYLVTEWQPGESLEARLTRVGPQPIGEVSRLLLPCIRAAHTAHLADIVQQPIKATTIYVCDPTAKRAEHAKLLDFELDHERALQPLASGSAAEASLPASQRPGSQRAKRPDPRVAVRAFGAIMYRALTGLRHTPFDQKPMRSTANAGFAPPPLLPPIVRWFVERSLSDACEDPFQTLEELAEALQSMSAALPEVSVRMTGEEAQASSVILKPMPLLPASLPPTTAPHLSMPSPVTRQWATTMRLPRALYAAPKPAPSRLPLAWIIAAAALVVTAGALALRREPPRSQTSEEEVVASYNAATSYDPIAQHPPAPTDTKPWRATDDQPLVLPQTALPSGLQPPAAPSVLKRASLTPFPSQQPSQPASPAARNTRQRTRAPAAGTVNRSISRAGAVRTLPTNDRSSRSPSRARTPAPKDPTPMPPAVYPRPIPVRRPAAESVALDNMGLL